jgi:hypothetical protein
VPAIGTNWAIEQATRPAKSKQTKSFIDAEAIVVVVVGLLFGLVLDLVDIEFVCFYFGRCASAVPSDDSARRRGSLNTKNRFCFLGEGSRDPGSRALVLGGGSNGVAAAAAVATAALPASSLHPKI